jgi:hypothetical protein
VERKTIFWLRHSVEAGELSKGQVVAARWVDEERNREHITYVIYIFRCVGSMDWGSAGMRFRDDSSWEKNGHGCDTHGSNMETMWQRIGSAHWSRGSRIRCARIARRRTRWGDRAKARAFDPRWADRSRLASGTARANGFACSGMVAFELGADCGDGAVTEDR